MIAAAAAAVPHRGGALFAAGAKVAVVQPLPGIGDMIWHLPHIRALAAAAGEAVTLVAKPGSAADQIFAAEPSVARVLWTRRNTAGRRGAARALADHLALIAALRAARFDAAVLLHHSHTLAATLALAAIPLRYGYGFGRQRLFLNRPPFLAAAMLPVHPFGQASAWIAAAGLAMAVEPTLPVQPAAVAAVQARLRGTVRPAVIGIGSSEPAKQWGATRFAELALRLHARGWRHIVLLGGPAEAALATEIGRRAAADLKLAIGWQLTEVAALLAGAAFFVGNDTGTANIAAAVGARTFVLFGATPPFDHSARIVPITPPDGIDRVDGMARIAPAAVMEAIIADMAPAER